MSTPDFSQLVADQRAYFNSGATRPVEWRVAQLNAMKTMIYENREAIYDALWHDIRRNDYDSDLMDVDFSINEAQYALKHLHKWVKPERMHTPLVFEPGHIRVRRDPLGVTLIIGAWNEPLMLTRPARCCHRRRQHGRPQAFGALRGDFGRPGSNDAQVLRHQRVRCSRRGRAGDDGAAGREVGHDLFHRQPSGGPDRPPGGGEASDTVRTRAGRQEPDHRAQSRPISAPPPGGSPTAATSTAARSAPLLTTSWSGPK